MTAKEMSEIMANEQVTKYGGVVQYVATEPKTRAQRKAEAREKMKSSILLDEQIQTIGRAKREAEAEKKRQWAIAHPVSAGVIPLVDYVPPAGRYQPA